MRDLSPGDDMLLHAIVEGIVDHHGQIEGRFDRMLCLQLRILREVIPAADGRGDYQSDRAQPEILLALDQHIDLIQGMQ